MNVMSQPTRAFLASLLVMVLLSPLAIDIYLPSIPQMIEDMRTSTERIQATIALFLAAMGVGQLVAGPLSDKYGRRIIALSGVFLYLIGAGVASITESLSMLYSSRILQGFGAACSSVTAFACIRDVFDAKTSSRWISYLNSSIGVIPALAPLLGGVLASYWGWRSNFVFMLMFGALLWVWLFVGMKDTRPASLLTRTDSSWARDIKHILSNGQFLLFTAVCMLSMGAILVYVSQAPIVAMKMAGASKMEFAMMFGGNAVVIIIASLLTPEISDRIGARRAVVLGLIFFWMGTGLMTQVSSEAPLWFFLPVVVSSIGFSLCMGPGAGLALAPFKHCAGTASALLGFIQMTGGGLVGIQVNTLALSAFEQYGLALAVVGSLMPLVMLSKAELLHQEA